MNRETLDDRTGHHDTGAEEDGPPAAESIVNDGNKREREDSPQRVGGGNHAFQGALRVVEVCYFKTPSARYTHQ